MPEIEVSSKRIVYSKFIALAVSILIAGRMMLSDPNIVYRYFGAFAFVGFNLRAMMLAVYIQYRGKHGWGSTVDIPDND